LFWALAAVVGMARVYARVHHPLDVLGSLLFAALALAIYAALRWLWVARGAARTAPVSNI
jgi:membrane-associated phospholipid phosphatase